jgi:3-oxoadipate enol-lactonase
MMLNTPRSSIHYTVTGSGPALMLVHGFPLDSRVWNDVVPSLAKRCTVVTLDLPGFGQSVAKQPFTMSSLAADLVALADELKLPKFAIAGLSMGGYVSLTLARDFTSRLSALILVDSKASADDDAGKTARNNMIHLVRNQGTPAVADAMMPRMLHADAYANREDVVALLKSIMLSQSPATIENACAAMRDRDDFVSFVHHLEIPFGIVIGAGDVITPPAGASALISHHGVQITIDGAGHMAPIEAPAAVARAIDAILSYAEVR